MDEIQSLFDFCETRGINIHFVGVTRQFHLQFAQRLARLRVQRDQIFRAGIHALKFRQHATDDAGLREQ